MLNKKGKDNKTIGWALMLKGAIVFLVGGFLLRDQYIYFESYDYMIFAGDILHVLFVVYLVIATIMLFVSRISRIKHNKQNSQKQTEANVVGPKVKENKVAPRNPRIRHTHDGRISQNKN